MYIEYSVYTYIILYVFTYHKTTDKNLVKMYYIYYILCTREKHIMNCLDRTMKSETTFKSM